MTDKLNGIEERYEKINELLCSPDIISNQQEYAKLMKEQKNLTPVVEKFREYKQYEKNFNSISCYNIDIRNYNDSNKRNSI